MARQKKGAAQAQAQANKQQAVSKQESLSLVQNLLRVSVFHTAYLRGLFPEHKFQATTMRNLENMKIRMLAPTCPETKRMNDWIEKDVHEALSAGFLHSLHFCVCKDRGGTDLIEQYSYTFTYTAEGKACMDVRVSNKKKGRTVKNKAPPDPESIRCQVVRMLRMLVEITSTLDRMPEERYLLMKVEYTEDTPADFGTPNFSPAGPEQLKAHFERRPFTISAGEVDTGHHAVSVRVHSIMDLDDDEAEEDVEESAEEEADDAAAADAHGDEDAHDGAKLCQGMSGAAQDPTQTVANNGPLSKGATGDRADHAFEGEEKPQGEARRAGVRQAVDPGHRRKGDDSLMASPDDSPIAGAIGAQDKQYAAGRSAAGTGKQGHGQDGLAVKEGLKKVGAVKEGLNTVGAVAAHDQSTPAPVKWRTRKESKVPTEDIGMTPKPGKRGDEDMRGGSDDDGVGCSDTAAPPSQALTLSQGAVVVCSQGKRRGAAVRSPIEQVKRFKGSAYGRMAAMRCE
eukprot:jgi/Ulvmu1/1669/UM114_0043.1